MYLRVIVHYNNWCSRSDNLPRYHSYKHRWADVVRCRSNGGERPC